MKRYELIKEQLELAASDREKDEARAAAEVAAAETFEAAEDDVVPPGVDMGGHKGEGKGRGSTVLARLPRRLNDEPAKLLLLQVGDGGGEGGREGEREGCGGGCAREGDDFYNPRKTVK